MPGLQVPFIAFFYGKIQAGTACLKYRCILLQAFLHVSCSIRLKVAIDIICSTLIPGILALYPIPANMKCRCRYIRYLHSAGYPGCGIYCRLHCAGSGIAMVAKCRDPEWLHLVPQLRLPSWCRNYCRWQRMLELLHNGCTIKMTDDRHALPPAAILASADAGIKADFW